MPIDELIREIEKVDAENLQDLLDAVINRCRQLNPKWEFVYFAYQTGKKLTSAEEKILQLAYEIGL